VSLVEHTKPYRETNMTRSKQNPNDYELGRTPASKIRRTWQAASIIDDCGFWSRGKTT